MTVADLPGVAPLTLVGRRSPGLASAVFELMVRLGQPAADPRADHDFRTSVPTGKHAFRNGERRQADRRDKHAHGRVKIQRRAEAT